ncbi:hypothetical protein GS506_13255 [Rhodococcus hoagii]|nr:hypothetical protein [Prescottella equi]
MPELSSRMRCGIWDSDRSAGGPPRAGRYRRSSDRTVRTGSDSVPFRD